MDATIPRNSPRNRLLAKGIDVINVYLDAVSWFVFQSIANHVCLSNPFPPVHLSNATSSVSLSSSSSSSAPFPPLKQNDDCGYEKDDFD